MPISCPACRVPLFVLEFEGVAVDYCGRCSGIWLDVGELSMLMHGLAGLPEWDEALGSTPGKRRCPRCGVRMRVGRAAGGTVDIDVCPRRHGVWLDNGELAAIMNAGAADDRSRRAASHLGRMFAADLKTKEK